MCNYVVQIFTEWAKMQCRHNGIESITFLRVLLDKQFNNGRLKVNYKLSLQSPSGEYATCLIFE